MYLDLENLVRWLLYFADADSMDLVLWLTVGKISDSFPSRPNKKEMENDGQYEKQTTGIHGEIYILICWKFKAFNIQSCDSWDCWILPL